MAAHDLSPVDAVAMFSLALDAERIDPLARFKCTSPVQRSFLSELGRGEIYLHSGNKFGKTVIGAVAGVSMARGLRTLDGIDLPALPVPNVGLVLSKDYKQQRLSVQGAYLEALGSWPHKAEWNGETLVSLRVKPDAVSSDDPRDWSLIMFQSQENRRSGVGARCHWCHADEPPREDVWREVRKAGKAGALFVNYITATPLKRADWYWLREDYPDPRLNEGKWVGRFLRLRGESFANEALTERDKAELAAMYASDPQREARLLGLEIDTSGSSPFREVMDELERWFAAATDGEMVEWKVSREVPTESGKQLVTELVEVEFWADEPDPRCTYRIIVDPSLGIADGEHDPACVSLFDMTRGVQVARYSGFLGEYGAGVLAGGLSAHWNNALVDVATTGGYGSACLSGLRAAGCRNVATRQVKDHKGVILRTDIGFTEGADTRASHAAALIEALKASKAGAGYLTVRSRADLSELMDLTFDKKGRIVTQPGLHDEAFTVLGRWATLLTPDMRRQSIPAPRQRIPESIVDVLRRESHLPPRRSVAASHTARPRMRTPLRTR